MDYYGKARREGLRVYSAAIQNNRDPYLPVLEDKVPNLSQLSRQHLGVFAIPLNRILGAVSQGRSYAFASNFMPILESGSEFSNKWNLLYAGVMEKGVVQPITVLEYLGNYYVIEGNKRVSVSKSMESWDIDADVTRIWPERTEDPQVIAYYEYCDFSRETGYYNLLFTKPGSYRKLVSLPGVRAGESWTEEELLTLKKIVHYFYSSYSKVMQDRACMPESDAFLSYLVAFGYEDVRDDDQDKTTERVRLMSREFEVHDNRVNLIMESDKKALAPKPLLSLFRPSKIKAAFMFTRPTADSAWNYWHDLGRLAVEEKLQDKVETATRIVPSRDEFELAAEALIKDGYNAIFATSPVMLNSCIEPALEHPDVKFLCCSLLSSYTNIRTYYIRFYEAKFLLGLAAGILAKNGKIGYIADFPIYGTASAANAFAIGARMVNPDAKIYLNWFSADYFNASNPFLDPEIRVICNRDITAPNHTARDYGLYLRRDGEISNIATMIPQWGPFYQTVIERLLNGTFNPGENRDSASNYWWGISSGMLDVAFSTRFDPYALRLIRHYQEELDSGTFSPFEGELRDQQGQIRCEADRRLTPAEILCMDYLADNIIGSFPSPSEIIPSARPLVQLQGIHGELVPELSSFSWNRK